MLIFGHRGSSGTDPENTMPSFRQAIAVGADGVELDARATIDGIPIVIHDGDVSRATTGSGTVETMTLAEAQRIDAGDGERIPTLDEVIGLLAGLLTIDIEIKQAGIERLVLDVLNRHPAADWFISCFDWGVLENVRRLSPAAAVWPLAVAADDALFAIAARLQSPGIALQHRAYTVEVAERCAAAGLLVGVWTVNDPTEGRRVQALGAATLMTDYPAMMRSALTT
ncbi:MAG: hypothetical protein M3464_11500 [Chloroflexota bacterium]|nr:hypothetical protein [Chloroflexota bacterium]